MEKLLNRKVPAIRFKEFKEGWHKQPIGKVFAEKKRPIALVDDQEYELITVKRRNGGITSRGHLLGREILVKNYYQLKAGDFVVSKRQVVHGATGIVPETLNNAIVSNEYLVAEDGEQLTAEFMNLLSFLPDMKSKFFLSSYGVDIEKLFFDADDWKQREVTTPDVAEQRKIASYFKALDKTLTLHQHKHDKLVTLKQAMLQKMFPQKGAATPDIRFKEFESEWSENALGDLGTTYSGLSGKTKEDFGHGEGRYVTYVSVFSKAISDANSTEKVEIDSSQNEVRYGDVFFTVSSETPEEVGLSSVWLDNSENTYLNSFCFGFRPNVAIDLYFLAYVLRSQSFRKSVVFLAQGISRYNISKSKVMKLSIMIPDLSEQQKIGNYFQKLDQLIDQHAIQLEKLKQIKAACLERMFV